MDISQNKPSLSHTTLPLNHTHTRVPDHAVFCYQPHRDWRLFVASSRLARSMQTLTIFSRNKKATWVGFLSIRNNVDFPCFSNIVCAAMPLPASNKRFPGGAERGDATSPGAEPFVSNEDLGGIGGPRATSSTNMNERSSRSHSIFIITVA